MQLLCDDDYKNLQMYKVGKIIDLKQNDYNLVNLYASWNISEQLTTSLNVNNLTNEFALTEAEEGSAAVGSIIRGRPVSGRSMSLGLRYNF